MGAYGSPELYPHNTYCKKCGKEVDANANFCEHCGKNLTEAVVTENRQAQKGEKRCKTCGNVFSKYLSQCPYCGAGSIQLIPAKLTKCKKCNQNMAENVMQCPHCGKRTATFYIVRAAIAIVAICFLYLFTSFLKFETTTQNANTPNTGLTADDITKVEFKLTARDDSFNIVHTTSKITITK